MKNADAVWRLDQLAPLELESVIVVARTGTTIATVAIAVSLATLEDFA